MKNILNILKQNSVEHAGVAVSMLMILIITVLTVQGQKYLIEQKLRITGQPLYYEKMVL